MPNDYLVINVIAIYLVVNFLLVILFDIFFLGGINTSHTQFNILSLPYSKNFKKIFLFFLLNFSIRNGTVRAIAH